MHHRSLTSRDTLFRHPKPERHYMPSNTIHLSGLVRQDVRVTGIDDGHGGAVASISICNQRQSELGYDLPTEELSKSGAKLDLRNPLVSKRTGTLQSLLRLLLWADQKTWCLLTKTHKNHSPNSFAVKAGRNLRCCR
jgi:hypothetical protein